MPMGLRNVDFGNVPAMQQRGRELSDAMPVAQALFSGGDIGFNPNVQQVLQILGLLGSAGTMGHDVTGGMQRWAQPAMQGMYGADARDRAYQIAAQMGAFQGGIDPSLAGFMGTPGSTRTLATQGDILTQLAPFAHLPEYQQAAQRFAQIAGGSGTPVGGALGWASVASPYTALMSMGQRDLANQLFGDFHIPTSTEGYSAPVQDIIKQIAEAGAEAQGTYAAPGGTTRRTPRMMIQDILSSVGTALSEGFASPTFGGGSVDAGGGSWGGINLDEISRLNPTEKAGFLRELIQSTIDEYGSPDAARAGVSKALGTETKLQELLRILGVMPNDFLRMFLEQKVQPDQGYLSRGAL